MVLASIFTDGLVLQQGIPVKVFGYGKGTVSIDFLGNNVSESFDDEEWCVSLPSYQYGGPYEMSITLNGDITVLKDVYVGEVWIAAGQSNMEMPLFRTEHGFAEAKNCHNDKIRFFDVPRRVERNVQKYGWPFICTDGKDKPWQICDEQTALRFSAIGYYVAKELYENLNVAIGIIGCNWGCRKLETFISRDYAYKSPILQKKADDYYTMLKQTDMDTYRQELIDMYKFIKEKVQAIDYDEIERTKKLGFDYTRPCPLAGYPACYKQGPNHPDNIGVLYDSMVSRIVPYGVKGFLWYQGESNGGDYDDMFGVFMECMKDKFRNKDMKFYSVQIASYRYTGLNIPDNNFVTDANNKAFTREAQQRAADRFEDNHIVTTMQLEDIADIHPKVKAPLAHRMVLKMLKYSYGFNVKCEHPTYESAEFCNGKAYIKIKNGSHMMSPDLWAVKMFVADESKQLKRAKIEICDNMIILSSPEVTQPILARFAFDSYYLGEHIINDIGLPLAPFRTDS